jgi:peptidoglycan/LPS O-acetylase OafA/YrhL
MKERWDGALHKNRVYRPELDVLRCVAFLLVFLHHSRPFTHGLLGSAVTAGAFGVCLFFFLSAFLITDLLDREVQSTGTIRLGSFYVRRMLRIWPLYLAVLLLDFLHLSITQPGVFTGTRLAAFLLLCGNWYVSAHGLIGSFSAPLWSISVEEQFYLLWPSIRRFGGRSGSVLWSVFALTFAYAALLFVCRRGVDPATALWTNGFVQFQFFATGCLLALLLNGRAPFFRGWQRVLLALLGLGSIFLAQSVFQAKEGTAQAHFHLVAPGYLMVNLGCLLLFLGFLGAEAPSRWKPVIYLGKISYGLYVFHWGFLSLFDKLSLLLQPRFPQLTPWIVPLRTVPAFLCTVVLAALSYRFFEQPFLRYKRRFEVIRTRPV